MEHKMLTHLFGDLPDDDDIIDQRARELRQLDDADVMPQDESPKVWHEEHPELTEQEMALGEALGKSIDIDDDEDNGGVS